MTHSTRITGQQGLILALGILMALSRPYPLSGIVHLADASNAVFFLGGLVGLSSLVFSGFVLLVVAIDFLSIASGTDPFCISPAYVFLLPAFAALWFGGGQLTRVSQRYSMPATLLAFSVLQCVAFFISSGSFYFLSGKFANPSWAVMLERSAHYLPGYFMSGFWYVLLFVVLQRGVQYLHKRLDASL